MKTVEEIFCKHLGEYVPCEQKNVVLTYIETNVILKAMEEYAQQRVEEATRWIPVKLGGELNCNTQNQTN